MLKSLSLFLRYLLFWILFFAVNRFVFEAWSSEKFTDVDFIDILKTFLYGMHMDLSMACYLSIIPFFLFIYLWFKPDTKFGPKFLKYYTFTLVVITIAITCVDFNIYTEWGTKISGKVLEIFFTSPAEAMASSSSSPYVIVFFIAVAMLLVSILLYKWLIKFEFKNNLSVFIKIPLALLIFGLTFLGIRGGWGISPMNPSKVYFSNKPILNHSAINTNWLLLSNYLKKADNKNHYDYFTPEEKTILVKNLYPKIRGEQTDILNTKTPNVVLFILESFTADVVKELGGENNVTPEFSKLINEGLLFSNIYSTSDRTDKGLVAILSAFPSQATKSIIKENNKQEKLPAISNDFDENGFKTSFFYGGDTDFSNFKSYLLSHKIQTLVDSKNLETKDLTSKWGAYDEVILNKHFKYLQKEKQPFFSTLLTLSNHEPFDLPKPGIFEDNSVENKFRNTSHYTAEKLFEYINNAKKQPWYKNTLFIFIADHGHRLPKSINDIFVAKRYHIPLLMMGGALKDQYKGQIIEKFGSQTDLASTLLSQLNISDKAYKYSNNLLDSKSPEFAFYCWDNGFGIVDKNKAISFDPISQKVIFSNPDNVVAGEKEKALTNAKALMQSIYQDYLDY